jgi:hypothetical protein
VGTTSVGADDHDDADVSAQVHELLADPLEFLLWVSGVVGGDEGLDELDHLVEGLAQQTCWAMWSVLAAIGELSHHDELRARCRRALERPHSPLPDWVARLDETVAYGALKSTYAGGDRDDVIVGLRLANGYEFAVVVGVRRETNEVIDLLAIRAPLADVPQKVRVVTGGRVPTTTAVALDAARRRIGRALGSTDSTLSFVMVRWVVRVLERADGVVSTPDVSGPGAEWYAAMLDLHARRVGGTDALARLDAAPLPDEPFRWDGIPDDIRARVTAVVDLCDACADALGSVEYRTAFRRFLAAAIRARSDAGPVPRRPRRRCAGRSARRTGCSHGPAAEACGSAR